ncbi:hypothetical protein WJX79_008202 [Trebouxia sp. C0005]
MVILAPLLDQVAIMATSLFCGAAVYVSLVEQPARMQAVQGHAASSPGQFGDDGRLFDPVWVCLSRAIALVLKGHFFPQVDWSSCESGSQQALPAGCATSTASHHQALRKV